MTAAHNATTQELFGRLKTEDVMQRLPLPMAWPSKPQPPPPRIKKEEREDARLKAYRAVLARQGLD